MNNVFNNNSIGMNRIYSVVKACEYLSVSRMTLHKWRKNGALKSYKKGKRIFLFHSDIVEFLKSNPNE